MPSSGLCWHWALRRHRLAFSENSIKYTNYRSKVRKESYSICTGNKFSYNSAGFLRVVRIQVQQMYKCSVSIKKKVVRMTKQWEVFTESPFDIDLQRWANPNCQPHTDERTQNNAWVVSLPVTVTVMTEPHVWKKPKVAVSVLSSEEEATGL